MSGSVGFIEKKFVKMQHGHMNVKFAGRAIFSSLVVKMYSSGQEFQEAYLIVAIFQTIGQSATHPYAEPNKSSPYFFLLTVCISENAAAQLSEAMRYKPEGRRFGSGWFY
jgi:hypothetical protein